MPAYQSNYYYPLCVDTDNLNCQCSDLQIDDLLLKVYAKNDPNELPPSSSECKLKRSKPKQSLCISASEKPDKCTVEAKQVEIDILSRSTHSFAVIIRVPNGESSKMIFFKHNGDLKNFCPKMDGCGHGVWKIEVFKHQTFGIVRVAIKELDLDGVGSLVFVIGDDMIPHLHSQEFLHIPATCHRCPRRL